MTKTPDDDNRVCRTIAREHLEHDLAALRAEGWSTLASSIGWTSALEDWLNTLLDPHFPFGKPAPERKPARCIDLTLALPEGGPDSGVRVTIHTVVDTFADDGWVEYPDAIQVTVFEGERQYPGKLIIGHVEMRYSILALRRDPPAELMQRALDALYGIATDDWPVALYAALLPATRCHVCGRPLGDPVSRVLGMGSDCAAGLSLAHAPALAERVAALRQGRG